MSIEQTWQTVCTSLSDTLTLAGRVGSKIKGGEVIDLTSDLGGGKTSFVQGLVAGMGGKDNVHSPSFTVSNLYKVNQFTIYHFDFYRLNEAGIMQRELQEALDDKMGIVIVEWADIIRNVLPPERMMINIRVTGDTSRELIFNYPLSYKYLIP